MACFTVPVAEAIVTTVIEKVVKAKENKAEIKLPQEGTEVKNSVGTPFSVKLGWLNKMLWLGSLLLAFEHIWHGEVIPVFPFLTAVQNGNVSEMLAEMATVGVLMAVIVTAVWALVAGVVTVIEKRSASVSAAEKTEENAQ